MRLNLTSIFQKTLSIQTAFKPHLASLSAFHIMCASKGTIPPPSQSSEVTRVLKYWFNSPDPVKKWFSGGPQVDEEVRTQFLPLIAQARSSELSNWKNTPTSTLALLILLDQFPRNVFRGTPESFASDKQALEISTEAIAKGFDQQVPLSQTMFFYMPLMHAENLASQVACVALMELLGTRCDGGSQEERYTRMSVDAARKHRNAILSFKRFPSRNKILGRQSTEEEKVYLEEYPHGF